MRKTILLGTGLLGGLLALSNGAFADPVYLEFLRTAGDPGAVTATGPGSASVPIQTLGGFSISGSVTGSPFLTQPGLSSTTLDVKTNTTGLQTMFIWAWETGITAPLGSFPLLSGFTSNLFNGPVVSAVETTYISPSDASFVTATNSFAGTQVAQATFTGIGSTSISAATPVTTGPYSEAEEYAITFDVTNVNTPADAELTITTSDPGPVPEPVSMALLGSGLVGLGLVRRFRA